MDELALSIQEELEKENYVWYDVTDNKIGVADWFVHQELSVYEGIVETFRDEIPRLMVYLGKL